MVVVVECIRKDWGIEVFVYKLEVGVIMIRENLLALQARGEVS